MMHKREMYNVALSFIPAGTVLFLYMILDGIFTKYDINFNLFIHMLLTGSLVLISNFIAFITLFNIIAFSIYWRSAFLANILLIGFLILYKNFLSNCGFAIFGGYLVILSFFHMSEFVFTGLFNHKKLTTDSFLLNHSMSYISALLASWLEFFIELYFFPNMKTHVWIVGLGICVIAFGEFFRKLAMYTAGVSFNHSVQERRSQDHVLVTNGVYGLVRHPAYFGWFYWSIGTQIFLSNPICAVLYTIASWSFFYARINDEEFYLKRFFGQAYTDYQKQVPSGVPFVKGCLFEDDDRLD